MELKDNYVAFPFIHIYFYDYSNNDNGFISLRIYSEYSE